MNRLPESFRDPAGFLFAQDNVLYRQVNLTGAENFSLMHDSELYDALIKKLWLIPHKRNAQPAEGIKEAFEIIQPQPLSFISYPYEWCFSQLKDAALLTLDIQRLAISHGMSLKDASAYNVQFSGCQAIFIDTLSFEAYKEGAPWAAYRQFCQHFLAPLALMAYSDIALGRMLQVHIDGIPLSLASRLLPWRTRLHPGLLLHLHIHSRSQKNHAGQRDRKTEKTRNFSRQAMLGLIDNLSACVRKLTWNPEGTEWADYYSDNNNYSSQAMDTKSALVKESIASCGTLETIWDLGANTGQFSRIASEYCQQLCAWDVDPACVEQHYLDLASQQEVDNILPLLLDLTTPSPAIGWSNKERSSFSERGPADLILALGLIHHLAISNNVPLGDVASMFANICQWLVIEFVPKSDSQVKKLFATRPDIFPDYTEAGFEKAFMGSFEIIDKKPIAGSDRYLFKMKRLDEFT